MKTHIAQEVNKAQFEEVTQLTVNRILERSAMATMMTCCSAGRTNQPQREGEATLSLDLLQKMPAPLPQVTQEESATCRVQ